jgi:hypothetical protein
MSVYTPVIILGVVGSILSKTFLYWIFYYKPFKEVF